MLFVLFLCFIVCSKGVNGSGFNCIGVSACLFTGVGMGGGRVVLFCFKRVNGGLFL